ncbi:MAG: type II CAAX endopeptidase family protein [Dehalococcoidia bacterium]
MPESTSRWPALWRSPDAILALVLLAQLMLVQRMLGSTASLVATVARGGVLAGLAFTLFPTTLTALAVGLLARRRGLSMRQIGFVAPRSWRPATVTWVVAVSVGPLTAWGSSLLAATESRGLRAVLDAAETDSVSPWVYVALAVALGAMVPIVEELTFRGLIHRTLRTRWSLVPSAAVSGLVFAAAHLDPPHLLPLFVLGFALAWSYERSGSLWGSIVPHGGLNALTVLVLATRGGA